MIPETISLDQLNRMRKNTLDEHLGIEYVQVGPDYLVGTMPVGPATHQPFGMLHGGASVALAESLGSMAANLTVDQTKYFCVGLDINSNHLKPVRSGSVTGTARPLHAGRSIQVWEIRIVNDSDELINISRLTVAVREKRN